MHTCPGAQAPKLQLEGRQLPPAQAVPTGQATPTHAVSTQALPVQTEGGGHTATQGSPPSATTTSRQLPSSAQPSGQSQTGGGTGLPQAQASCMHNNAHVKSSGRRRVRQSMGGQRYYGAHESGSTNLGPKFSVGSQQGEVVAAPSTSSHNAPVLLLRSVVLLSVAAAMAGCGSCGTQPPVQVDSGEEDAGCVCADGGACLEDGGCGVEVADGGGEECGFFCPHSFVCSGGRCVEAACAKVVCGTRERCAGGACLPTSCGAAPCPPGWVCEGAACVDPACVGVACPAGKVCANGSCQATACGSTTCGPGLACAQGKCVATTCLGVVCPVGTECALGGCAATSCAGQACQAGFVCDQGKCIPPVCVGVACQVGEECAGGVCMLRQCFDRECPPGSYCTREGCTAATCANISCAAGHACAAGECKPLACAGQTCGPGWVCEGGACVSALCVGVQCTQGRVCAAGVCASPGTDADGDLRADSADNCPATYNPGQANTDGDAFGDSCDCGDQDWLVYPGSVERFSDGVDNDCDGLVDCADPDVAADCTPEGTSDAGVGPICFPNGWCWANPLPQGVRLNGVWGSGPNTVWAVGEQGTILRWRGAGWAAMESPTSLNLNSIWGSGKNEAWAVGDVGKVLRWNGTRWTDTGSVGAPLYSVWGSSFRDVWVVGALGTARHWNGASWTTAPTGTTDHLRVVMGSGAQDVWAGGDNGTLAHWDGAAWALAPSGTSGTIVGLWVDSPFFALATTDEVSGMTLHWTGSTWVGYQQAGFAGFPLWGLGSQTVLGGQGGLWAHDQWRAVAPSGAIRVNGLWGSAATDVWGVGDMGFVTHWNGAQWSPLKLYGDRPSETKRAVHGFGSAEVWAAGKLVHVWGGNSWSPSDPGGLGSWGLAGLWGSSPSDVWVVTPVVGGAFSYWNGSEWRTDWMLTVLNFCHDVWGTGPSDVWCAGNDGHRFAMSYWNGTLWDNGTMTPRGATQIPGTGVGIWGADPQNYWVVGSNGNSSQAADGGVILHWNGVSWDQEPSGSLPPMTAVSGTSATDVWVVGERGTILHSDGVAWTAVDGGVGVNLNSLHARASDDVWAAGDFGAVIHWNGSGWESLPGPSHYYFTAVWANSASDVWLFGPDGIVLRRQP